MNRTRILISQSSSSELDSSSSDSCKKTKAGHEHKAENEDSLEIQENFPSCIMCHDVLVLSFSYILLTFAYFSAACAISLGTHSCLPLVTVKKTYIHKVQFQLDHQKKFGNCMEGMSFNLALWLVRTTCHLIGSSWNSPLFWLADTISWLKKKVQRYTVRLVALTL